MARQKGGQLHNTETLAMCSTKHRQQLPPDHWLHWPVVGSCPIYTEHPPYPCIEGSPNPCLC